MKASKVNINKFNCLMCDATLSPDTMITIASKTSNRTMGICMSCYNTMKKSMTACEMMEVTKNLPDGHPEKVAAKEVLKKEYSACEVIEQAFVKKFRIKENEILCCSEEIALELIYYICNFCNCALPKDLVLNSKQMVYSMSRAEYHFNTQSIHIRSNVIHMTTLIHELTHHVCYVENLNDSTDHGEVFLASEELLFDIVISFLKTKKNGRKS